jgi:hypothetical protein
LQLVMTGQGAGLHRGGHYEVMTTPPWPPYALPSNEGNEW